MALRSMTGYATRSGTVEDLDWVWEARSVNARGLDLRLRFPDGLEGLEPGLRKTASAHLSRGSVTVSLRVLSREAAVGGLDEAALDAVLATAAQLRDRAEAAGILLSPLSIGDLMSNRAVFAAGNGTDRVRAMAPILASEFEPLLAALSAARAEEGAALARILAGQLDQVRALVAAARAAAAARGPAQAALLRERVAALLGATDRVDEGRLAQELAVLAVKSDVTEELDRLDAHVAAAEALLSAEGPVGRKLDFLAQEFAREANTLAAKAGAAALTEAALELKVVVDQMREQCQNVE